jgi:hypothetical protein
MRYLSILLLIGVTLKVNGQQINPVPDYIFRNSMSVGRNAPTDTSAYFSIGPRFGATRGFMPPMVVDTAAVTGTKRNGLLIYSIQRNSFLYWDSTGMRWSRIAANLDTLLLSTRAWRQKGIDSLASVRIGGSGTLNYVPKFTASTTLDNSAIYQTPGGKIAIGTTTDTASVFNVIGNVRTGSLHVKSTGESIYMSTRSTGVGTSVYINDTSTALTGGGISNSYNTSLGRLSMRFLSTAYHTTGIGYLSLYNVTTGNNNTAVGSNSMSTLTTGFGNSALGHQSLYNTSSGFDNVALGQNALYGNTTGFFNVAIGNGAMHTGTTSNINIAIGKESMFAITTGDRNVGIGYQSLRNMTTGARNMSVGTSSLYELTTGSDNIAIGGFSLYNLKTTNNNVAIGAYAGQWTAPAGSTTKGNNNPIGSIYIGFDSRPQDSAQTNQIVIGREAVGNGSNTTTIGNSSVVGTYIPAGESYFGTTSDAGDFRVQVSGNQYVSGDMAIGTTTTSNYRFNVSGVANISSTDTTGTLNVRGQADVPGIGGGYIVLREAVPLGYANISIGAMVNSPYSAYLQVNNGTVAQDISLQPIGGSVGIGTLATAPSEKLHVIGNGLFSGSIKTGAPAGGTSQAWKLGTVATVSPTSPNRTIEVEVNGTIYYLHAKTTND